jgi:gliding motility-associated-like protein
MILLCGWSSLLSQSTVSLTIQDANCFSTTGTVTINSVTNSATPNYTITESTTTIAANVTLPYSIINVAVGNHTFVITGSNSVAVTFTAAVSTAPAPTVTATSPVTLICNPNTLTLNATTTATSVTTYTWTGPSIISGANTASPVVNQPGNYNLTWMNGSCTGTNVVSVAINTIVPTVTASVGGTVTCNAPLVLLTGTSNVSNASYSWSPQNVTTYTALSGGGNSTLTVTDPLNNCSTTTVMSVPQNTAAPNISASTNGYITCTQSVVVITGTSTTSGITYSWVPSGATTNSISVTSVGVHTFIVTDPSNGCKSVKIVTVFPIPAFSANTASLFNVKCNGASTGSAVINIASGSGFYSLTVNSTVSIGAVNSYSLIVPNLAAGNHTIFITDSLSGCTQLVNLSITEPPPLVLTLTLASQAEICEGEQVKINSSITGGVSPYQFAWFPFGGNTSTLDVFAGPNSYTLQATDANSCIVTAARTITVHPNPQTAMLNSPIALCGSVCVNFTLAAPQNTTFVYNWLFTDANNVVTPIQVNQYTPSICFTQPGKYDVDVSIFSPFGCSTHSIFPQFIKTYPFVKANFSYQQPEGAFIFNDVIFTNESSGASYYRWYNENDMFSDKYQPIYSFYEPGNYLVSLIALNDACSDTISKHISVSEATFIHVPNSFSPNHDGLNDIWQPKFYGDFQGGTYYLSVFNRWGKRVFWTLVIENGWDGTHKDGPCEDGIYTWEMTIEAGGISTKKKGMVTLIR